MSIAKAGTLLSVEKGEYSDYSVLGFFVVLRDFVPATELEEYLAAHPKQRDLFCFEEYMFLAALISKGLLLEIEHGELYLGSYSDTREFRWTPIREPTT